jgi:beta-N-acetylhexosaminidase
MRLRPVPRAVTALLLAATTMTALTGCGVLGDDGSPAGAAGGDGRNAAGSTATASSEPTPTDPDAPSGWGPTAGELARAADLVSTMSAKEKVVTVLMPGFWGYDGADPSPAEASQNQAMHGVGSAVETVTAQPYSGFFLRPEVISDADQIDRLTGQLHDAGDGPDGLPLLLSMDQEGGVVQRLKEGVDPVPGAASIGATGDPAYARKVARANGRTLRDLGVTMVLAPVADVDPDGSSVMGSRTYSTDREVAGEMVVASVEGYLKAGVIPAVKHFPGLGTVTGDSHRSLPTQKKSVEQLLRTDLLPFAAAVDAGAPVIMTGHVAVPAIEPGIPASLSSKVLTTLLRDELGFDGVAITDSQGMGPIHGDYGPAEGAVRSLLAGNDLILNSARPEKARKALLKALASGRIPQERLDEAATRVEALRIYQQRLASAAG